MPAKNQTSLNKAMQVLFAVGESDNPRGASVQDLIESVGVSRPTAYRFLKELEEMGLVQADSKAGYWQIGPKIIALSARASSWADLRRRAKIAMEEFVADGGPTVHMAIRDRFEVVYIDKAESLRHAAFASAVGQRRPVSVTALGKALVAFDANPDLAEKVVDAGLIGRTPHSIIDAQTWLKEIEQVREHGVAYDLEECELGASCVAAPILDPHGLAVAAISMSTLLKADQKDELSRMERKIRQLAESMSG